MAVCQCDTLSFVDKKRVAKNDTISIAAMTIQVEAIVQLIGYPNR